MASYHKSENKTIEYVVIGNSIQIGNGNSASIDNIYNETLEIPSSIESKPVTVIGKKAFYQCNIGEIILPETITTICESAFEQFRNCKQIIFPSSLKLIDNAAFFLCSIELCDLSKYLSLTFQNEYHFAWSSINRMILPSTLTELSSTFLWCSSIKEFTFPKSMIRYHGSAFVGTQQLKTLKSESPYFVVHNNIVYSPNFRIIYKYPIDTYIDILPSAVRIYGGAFSGSSFVNFSFKNKIKIIEFNAFRMCTHLKFCDLRNVVSNSIPHAIFMDCTKLETVIFPSTCNQLNTYVFYGCSSLNSIYIISDIHNIGENFTNTNDVNIYYCGTTQIDASVPSSTIVHVTKLFPKEVNQIMSIHITDRDYKCTYSNEILQFFNQYAFLCTVQQICYQQFSLWTLLPIIL